MASFELIRKLQKQEEIAEAPRYIQHGPPSNVINKAPHLDSNYIEEKIKGGWNPLPIPGPAGPQLPKFVSNKTTESPPLENLDELIDRLQGNQEPSKRFMAPWRSIPSLKQLDKDEPALKEDQLPPKYDVFTGKPLKKEGIFDSLSDEEAKKLAEKLEKKLEQQLRMTEGNPSGSKFYDPEGRPIY